MQKILVQHPVAVFSGWSWWAIQILLWSNYQVNYLYCAHCNIYSYSYNDHLPLCLLSVPPLCTGVSGGSVSSPVRYYTISRIAMMWPVKFIENILIILEHPDLVIIHHIESKRCPSSWRMNLIITKKSVATSRLWWIKLFIVTLSSTDLTKTVLK